MRQACMLTVPWLTLEAHEGSDMSLHLCEGSYGTAWNCVVATAMYSEPLAHLSWNARAPLILDGHSPCHACCRPMGFKPERRSRA